MGEISVSEQSSVIGTKCESAKFPINVRYFAPFRNHSVSKVTDIENQSQILHC